MGLEEKFMGGLSIWHWLIVLVVVLLIFGNRLPRAMGDLAKGIKNFKSGLSDDPKSDGSDDRPAVPPPAGTEAGSPNRTTVDRQ
ncbi:twin-arginine translocase TatA/TatE family subunit [Inquilinus sp. YAF38]|uniref:twin-arginine translocase TatA/TatE family subunit n=1 Tax=Inquilinus sp. YAF38 TaxID=3233084 RepID=UPI003F910FB6